MLPSFWIEDRSKLALIGSPYDLTDAEQARARLAAELPNLTKAVTYAVDHSEAMEATFTSPAPFAWHRRNGPTSAAAPIGAALRAKGWLVVRGPARTRGTRPNPDTT